MTYEMIHNAPIILSTSYAKKRGGLSGAVILVDKGTEYVVSTRSNDEATGIPRKEWNQGNYFCHSQPHHGPQSKALAEALVEFERLVKRES
jgi:hypothetical protein